MTAPPVDVLIVGGGPAGATLAAILLKYRPATRIRILERDEFPRFHVGETLVSDVNLVLAEMGAYDAVANAGFVKKVGATFRWGAKPEPWHLLFATFDELRPEAELSAVNTSFTWHIDRPRYDQILLDTAARAGAEVFRAAAAEVLSESGRVVGVRTREGVDHHARFVVDATGHAGLAGSLSKRVMDPYLQNMAYWGYFRGFALEEGFNGNLDQSRAFIVAHPHGWSWFFPIRPDLVSVGVVTRVEELRGSDRRDPATYFRQALASSPELSRLLEHAELVPYDRGSPLVHVVRDYSYISSEITTPGLARIGDAAGFVDPILSVGCFLGQSGARHLAYTLRSVLDGAINEEIALPAYADHVRETLSAFRELTWFFYRFNERKDEWWAQARRLVANAGFPARATDGHAFAAFASGFAARRSVFREPNGVFGEPFFADAFKRLVDPAGVPQPQRVAIKAQNRPQLLGPVTLTASAVPVDGTGTVIPALRVEVHTPAAHGGDALVRRIFVPPSMAPLFGWLDGSNDIANLVARMERELGTGTAHKAALVRYVRGVVEGLVERGLAR